jgi:hypothetical protein
MLSHFGIRVALYVREENWAALPAKPVPVMPNQKLNEERQLL